MVCDVVSSRRWAHVVQLLTSSPLDRLDRLARMELRKTGWIERVCVCLLGHVASLMS